MIAGSHMLLAWLFTLAAALGMAAEPAATAFETAPDAGAANNELAARALAIFQELPPPAIHFAGLSEAEAGRLLRSDAAYRELTREKLEQRWFAALVTRQGPEPYSVRARFDTWRGLVQFLAEQSALVEVWACGETGDHKVRRIPAAELADLKQQRHEAPTLVTATFRDPETGKPNTYDLEFGFHAAEAVQAANQAYQRHRSLQLCAHRVLEARNAAGLPDALAQWAALKAELEQHHLPPFALPSPPKEAHDVFVAFEFEVDDQNNFLKVAGLYRASEIQRQIRDDAQLLVLQQAGEKKAREVLGFRRQGLSDRLERAPNPLLGRDVVELRVKDLAQADPRRWHVVEFGEPELLQQSALAHFSQLEAYLERSRKVRAMQQANLALIAEPIIAGLNIGGGLFLLDFPAGEAARLLYNLVTWRLISNVPTAKQMRELFALMAARDRNPQFKTKPERFLNREDLRALNEAGHKLSGQDVQTYLQQMSEEDIRAMLRLARQGMLDARVTTFMSLLTSAFKLGGAADEAGPIRDIFNNVRFSMNGDINLKTLLMLAIGERVATPLSGASLQALSRGQGPQAAWLQYLEVSVDIRAVINTVVRLAKPTFAKKELEKPFPYSPRLSEPAAYEIRIFGFPLLMFYKRGLVKADLQAYEHDYAYGLCGVSVLEHFPTREAMEAEVRAGRMFPLGLVRVPTTGGWKDTDLVVYGHRIPRGKHRGKTTLVIYGLKAYSEYSELIARELLRFREFERGLREGAVIEQRLPEEADESSPATAFEPIIHAGADAVGQFYNPLLTALLEMKRNSQRSALGLPVDLDMDIQARKALSAMGVQPGQGDALVRVDPWQSRFIYRRQVGGREQRIQMTHIPSLAEMDRETERAEEARFIEDLRREAAAGRSAGVVLLNEAREVQGRFEAGPLLRNPQGQVVGEGVTSGAKALADIFQLIDRLPVTDRARLRANHFAATAVQLNREGEGKRRVFLTVEFPLGEVRQQRTNPLSGEKETVGYENGLWRWTIADRRIVEVDYDAAGIELRSRTFANRGTQQTPLRGALLEETRTLEHWVRDLSQPALDPYQPAIVKLHVNYVTGQFARETFGLFSLPLEVAEDEFITRSQYNNYGILTSASVFENGREEKDSSRPAALRVQNPVAGRQRFQLTSRQADNQELPDLSATGYQILFERKDLSKGIVTTQTLDQAHFGRKIAEDWSEPFDGTRAFSRRVTWEYNDGFQFGLIPVRAVTLSSGSGIHLADVTALAYDPLRRRLVGSETTYTGQTRTNTWDYRWVDPVEVETRYSRTVQDYNREETETRSTTTLKATGEIIESSSGKYDAGSRTWPITRRLMYQQDILDHVETNTYSPFGLLVGIRVGETLETRPAYTSDGIEQGRSTFGRSGGSGPFDVLCRGEDDYQWQDGGRSARVRLFVEGEPVDEYRAISDADGRVIEDGIRRWPQLEVRTLRAPEQNRDRLLQAEVLQNGQVRATHRVLGAFPGPDGQWLLKVAVTPAWGLSFTNSFRLGDPLGRLVETEFENRDRARVVRWFDCTALPRETEVFDRHGHPRERLVKQLHAGIVAGLPYDLVTRYRLSPWGDAGLAEVKALVQGTDVSLFADLPEQRIHFDLTKTYECPQFATDPQGRFGLPANIAGSFQSNVTALFTTRLRELGRTPQGQRSSERVLEMAGVDLRGLFYYPFSRRTFDRAGRLLEEQTGKIRNLGPRACSDTNLLADLSRALPAARTVYAFDPVWAQPKVDADDGTALFLVSERPQTKPGTWSVNDAGWREWPTGVRSYQLAAGGPALAGAVNSHVARVFRSPRWLKHNRYLPGATNVWLAWSSANFDAFGNKLFESELIFDAGGQLSTRVDHKLTSQGRPATKLVYGLPRPPPGMWRTVDWPSRTNHLEVHLGGPQDLSECDFIGFYLDAPAAIVTSAKLRDRGNHSALVTGQAGARDNAALSFWPLGQGLVAWLPNERMPEHGASVSAASALAEQGQAFVLSVAELAEAGLDVQRLASIDLDLAGSTTNSIRVTQLCRLDAGAPLPPPESRPRFSYDAWEHASGLALHRRKPFPFIQDTARERPGWSSILEYDGRILGSIHPRPEPPYYPVLMLTDNSDPEASHPLYALAAEDGRFLEYYQTRTAGDAQVYTVVNGFETPKVEMYRAGILDDEVTAGILGFGQGYYIKLPLAKAGGGVSRFTASLHNRCAASAFALGGQSLLEAVSETDASPTGLKEMTQENARAASQVQVINSLPMLAEALLSRRSLPWNDTRTGAPDSAAVEVRTNILRTALSQLSGIYLKTKLIPTAPGSQAERFVDTVSEADLIELAVKLHEPALANDLLAFYWEKSQGGALPLHACYDAVTGASVAKYLRYERPADAEVTAEAQLAIAEAAFCLGTATRDTNALEFGRNMLALLDKFRPGLRDTPWSGGIAEHVVQPGIQRHGLTLWHEPQTFSLVSNARAYLLFSRLAELAANYPFGPRWRQAMLESAREQAAWLTNHIVPSVEATGVVPKGLFEIQDVRNQTRGLAVERWTSTDAWLSFIEAADRMGLSRDLTRTWLDNLARVHGVSVRGIWGLDWMVPLQRPDAISTDLTAKFLRLALLLGHEQAADFARENLARLRQGDRWPAVWTADRDQAPIAIGQGLAIYPAANEPQPPAHKRGRPPLPAQPNRLAAKREGRSDALAGWPQALGVHAQLAAAAWPVGLSSGGGLEMRRNPTEDVTQFFWTTAAFYLSITVTTLFWWVLSAIRRRRRARRRAEVPSGRLVSDAVMQKGEERWAKRVLGMRLPAGAERSRYSNGAIEQNFHIHLRAIYKLVLEWRRLVNDWSEDDPRLVEGEQDEWLNGLDEFAVLVGIYTRWVIKAGRKDGLKKLDVSQENEDSNHIWARLVMYFSESHQRLLASLKQFKADPAAAMVLGTNEQIELVLRTIGLRARIVPCDARSGFDVPANASALDLLLLQLPGTTLSQVIAELERKWDVPSEHFLNFIKSYKSFKEREQVFPLHPYLIEAAKVLPHLCLMGLMGLIWYNRELGGLKIYPYLRQAVSDMALDWHSLIWALPLFGGFGLSVMAHALLVYRYRWGTGHAREPSITLDSDLTNLFGQATEAATPVMRLGRWWNPFVYQRAGWVFRAVGLGLLAVALFRLEPPSFVLFMCVKGLIGMLLLVESAGLLGPLLISRFSSWVQDRVTANRRVWGFTRFINQLNITPAKPGSLIWLSIKYHFQPSVPVGGLWPMLQAITSYLCSGSLFLFVGSYMFKQALEIWFQETYRHGGDVRLVLGLFLFWNTMYLLRFGLFVLLAALLSAAAIYPIRTACGLAAGGCLALQFGSHAFSDTLARHLTSTAGVLLLSLVLMAFESELLGWLRNSALARRLQARRQRERRAAVQGFQSDRNRSLGVVYMSGDDLSFYKLTPELLRTRLQLLRDRLSSGGARLLSQIQSLPDDATLTRQFAALYELEKRHGVTLWHPGQLELPGETPWLRPELGLNLTVESASQRSQMLAIWHLRRWLVTMMSTAGHAQDTGINLVDIALSLEREGLGASTVFYLIQNKYDDNDNNRPSQLAYDTGEAGQRDKLAHLLMQAAPGCRAYSICDWTPFGFKAGGLVGMDLVYEESLKLTNMLILDRNANAHDLDAVMTDVKLALSDPGVVIVIPGRSTTNTLTSIGQSSQLIEEGQRALIRGVMTMGGTGAETLGTGWGNIQAIYYGRVQEALCDANVSLRPLTTSSARNATFGDRCEGLIGFGPHAIGISEDIWGVTQAAHTALALGFQAKFHRSKALWHKIRETWSHAEWLAAFPRWAGGYFQMMLDPLMQQINDFGPFPVFAKEIRASGGRFFLGAPFALLSILLMPLAIIWDFSPFVQVLILLWNLGLVMNQVLTALGLVACLESTGFSRGMALAGATAAALLSRKVPALGPYGPAFMILGFLGGGFAMGLGRWLYYRGRDMVLFGPQLVIHVLGQVVRQSLEFVVSGASANDAQGVNMAFRAWVGPREDRPWLGYPNPINLRTVVWGVGLMSLLLNLFAAAHLDFLNVLLLLPSLMFSVSTLVGPFLIQPRPGKHLGWAVCVPKLLGWVASCAFYILVARLIARGGPPEWLGIFLGLFCFTRVSWAGLKYVGFSRRLRKLKAQLLQQMTNAGLALQAAQKLMQEILAVAGDFDKARAALGRSPLTEQHQASIAAVLQAQLLPLLRRPLLALQGPDSARRRFLSELSRSFVLGLFTFIWFFLVPMPGLLVFTAPGGRVSFSLAGVLTLAADVAMAILCAGCLSLLLEAWEKSPLRGNGFAARVQAQYRRLPPLAGSGGLSALQTSRLYALFTDLQTHFDQRSYACARSNLELIEQTLAPVQTERSPGHPSLGLPPSPPLQ
jgi:hypothetical protein